LIYTFFLTSGISWLFKHLPEKNNSFKRLNLLPLGAMLLDFLENINAAGAIGAYPSARPILACLAAIATPLKWLLVGASFLSLLAAVIMRILALVKGNK
jgi:hypothetical protein